ncbi:non-ribosomal peptide synthetase [Fluviispira multicolorata]|uniref:Amino acid adenylation domain-containing protein n=1 Tax=Fluviispira multicolorata TaxID=2654512 RepID=A0A833JFX1_9BACT|nr:non-ribosomal peptide synthetase [Fluviispira multicolorata]KAB8033633.1 amino acid adenylation domain-containing protein [Fluviispira multicolorata]
MNNKILLTPFQKTFYFEWKLDPTRTDYHMVLDQVLEGELDILRLNIALKRIISECYILNSHIEEDNGEYYWVKNNKILKLSYFENITNFSDVKKFIEEGFDLESGPLYRYGLFKIDEKKYRFIYIKHHALIDGASTQQIYSEISKYYNYENYSIGMSLSDQYENIAKLTHSLRDELEKNKENNINFWKKKLLDCESLDISFLKDPTLKCKKKLSKRETIQEYFGISEIKFSLNKEVFLKVSKIKKKYAITPYLFSKIIFAITLFKYTKQERFCISYPIAIKEGIDLVFGANVNINILPFHLQDNITVEDIILQCKLFFKSLKEEKIRYSYFPIYDIINYTKMNLNSATFSSANFQNILLELDGIKSSISENSNIALTNEFIFELEATSQGINFRVDYKNDIISDDLIKNFTKNYQHIYSEIVDDLLNDHSLGFLLKPIQNYNVFLEEDYEKIINNWNDTKVELSNKKTIPQLFEEQVERTPFHTVLVCGSHSFSYREINKKSNQLAQYLIDNFEIKPETLIALALDRNVHMLIAILATLKSGGAYVPIDPEFPKERVQYIMQDTNAKILLTNKIHKENLLKYCIENSINENIVSNKRDSSALKIISIDSDEIQEILCTQKDSNPIVEITENNLAYIIYTSGTTGKPKGVLIEQKGVVNLANENAKIVSSYLGNSNINCLWYANYVFDGHIWELCASIFHGHSLHLLSDEIRKDINLLSDYILAHKIDLAVLPPVLLSKENILKLKILVVGGDKTNKEILDCYLKNKIKVLNAYGPTEATVEASIYTYNSAEEANIIGKPIINNKIYILDTSLKPMPIGAIGELYIGGENLARGYLNRIELTSERFLNNPFQPKNYLESIKNSYIYKTGDLARFLPDGNIEYIGRNDFQVKIRGFRIELGEIENILLGYQDIEQVVVIAKDIEQKNTNSTHNKTLICYYVSQHNIIDKELAQYMSEKLPDYMIPSFFVCLSELPLNANGKVDKKRLPEVELKSKENYVVPKNILEENICTIWEEVLGVEKNTIGIQDDFFKLGGDSIICIQIVARLRHRHGIILSVKDIFKYKRIEKIAQFLSNESLNSKEELAIKSEQGQIVGESLLLPIQKWFFENEFPKSSHWNQSFLIKTPKLDFAKLQKSIEKLIEQHDSFRFVYTKKDDNWCQSYSNEYPINSINFLDVKTLYEEEGSNSFSNKINDIFTGWQSNFSLEKFPLFSFGYVEGFKNDSARIFVALHHLLVDAVSWRIITEDLQTLYEGKSLAKKGTSYRQWVGAIQDYHISHKNEKIYWDKVILDFKEISSSQNKSLSNFVTSNKERNRVEFKLSKYMTKQLLNECHSAFNTQVNDILVASFSDALSKFTGNTTHCVALEAHGREEIEQNIDITKTVGWFTCMYPVRLEKKNDFAQQIVATKETLRNIPNNGIGYGSFYGYNSDTLPRISFNYLGKLDNINDKSVWQIAAEESGTAIHPSNLDNNFISANGGILGENLFFILDTHFSKSIAENLSHYFSESLEEHIHYIINLNRNYLTSSDIDHVLSQEYLDFLQKDKEIENVYLANSLQQGFVYHSLKQGEKDEAYIEQIVWQYENEIDVEKLKTAWEHAIHKYENLRLRFAWKEEIVQIIDKKSSLQWSFIDLCQDKSEKNNFLNELQKKDRSHKFNLSEGNLSRVYLVKIEENKYTCVFSNHHAILDGWSNSILLNYVHTVYLNLIDNKLINTTPDTSYSETQKYLNAHKNENINYWKNYVSQIEDNLDLSNLLSDKAKAQNLSCTEYSFIQLPMESSFSIEGDMYLSLKQICQNHSVNLNALLQFAWHKVLSIYSNSSQTTVGTTVSGRNLPVDGIENSVGLFINTLPLFVQHETSNNKRVIDCIKEIQEQINEINTRSNINLTDIQKNGKRLFDSIFVFENYPNMIPKEFENRIKIQVRMQDIFEKLDYPLSVIAYERGLSLCFKLKYAGELFSASTIENLLSIVKEILGQISNIPNIELNSLSYLNSDQYKKIIETWNYSSNYISCNKTIIEIFEEKSSAFKDNIALVYKDEKISYKALNEKANQLAHFLKMSYEIIESPFIAICLNRSEQMIITILAILKLGKAYVPIEPNLPIDRIQYILKDAKPSVVLLDEENTARIESIYPTKTIPINSINIVSQVLKQEKSNLSENLCRNKLAYVIYTSGTTGQPKGVMMGHESCVIRILYMIKQNEMNQYDSFLFKTNIIFDVSFSDIFCTLISGAKLFITENVFNINELEKSIKENNISICHFVPSQFKIFSEEVNLNELKSLNKIMFSGESLEPKLINQFMEKEKIFLNYYGPTETGEVTVKKYSLDHSKLELNSNRSFIGKAFEQSKIYVLDKNLSPMPIQAVGELYVGGINIAQGYLNKQLLNIEKFIDNPFQNEEDKKINGNEKIYKTGDLVRWLENGELEYMGRNDNQVKIRGYRIELSEIESTLTGFQNIKQVIAIAKEFRNTHNSANQNKSIACYYISKNKLNEEEIIHYLSTKLPDYMIPSAFIHLEDMPLTANGKLNHKALPEPEFQEKNNYIAPRNEFEKNICSIWENILSLKEGTVGIQNDFFSLGGNSISAIKLVNQINKKIEIDISLQDVLEFKNINSILKNSEHTRVKKVEIKKLNNINIEEQSLSFAQERLWFIEKLSEGMNSYNVPMLYLLNSNINFVSLSRSLQEIISRHEILRTVIKETSQGIAYQIPLTEGEYLFHVNKFECKSKEEFKSILKKEMNYIYDLSQEIPIRISLYTIANKKGNQDHYLNIIVHHIAFDGWSVEIFLRELSTLYQYYENKIDNLNLKEKVPQLNIQYKDFSYWQKDYLKNNILKMQLEYWKNKFTGYETLDLHTDKQRPLQVSYEGRNVYFEIDHALSNELKTLAKKLDVSLYSLFLSAYYLMLSCFSGQKDIIVGSPISNRHYNQIADLIGFFVNTFALRAVIEPEISLIDFIKGIGNEVIEAQRNQDLPFEKLVEEILPTRDQSKHPLFQVLFSMQTLNAKQVKSFESDLFNNIQECSLILNSLYSPAKFDLSLFIDDNIDSFLVCFNYSTSLFYEETINNYLAVYNKILKEFCLLNGKDLNKEFCLKQINYLPDEHLEKISSAWKTPAVFYQKNKTISQIFEEQVERTPFHIALVSEKNKLTYGELNQKANQLANYLRENFIIQPDTFVALCLGRNEHMLIGILAVLKAGGAYIPIDPEFPKERMEYILQDTKAKVLLANDIYKDMLLNDKINLINEINSPLHDLKIVFVDSKKTEQDIFLQKNDNVNSQAKSHHLAYIIYTSGTTGKPKGVLVEHNSVVNLIESQRKFISQEFGDKLIKCLSFANYVFDAHVWELSASIFHGHCLYLSNNDTRKDIYLLSKYINTNEIQVAMLPPSLLDKDNLLDLELLLVAGDKTNKQILNAYLNKNTKVVNAYGPTETTVICYTHKYKSAEQVNWVGTLVANDRGYVLDPHLNILPIGAVGELYVGGVGVSRGYLNRDDLTLDRFFSNPFQTKEDEICESNARIYKTGDLVKLLPNGELEYIGRNDSQVKIRGFRIELGEIESALLGIKNIKQAVAIAKEFEHKSSSSSHNKTLICYYISENKIAEEELKHHLSEKLPEYMVPSYFVHLIELPLNVNGKLDKKALPDPVFQSNENHLAPRNELEKGICAIWEEILGLPTNSVGIQDNFFSLGGDSIMSIQVVVCMRNKMGVEISVKDIFNYKNVSKIARFIENNSKIGLHIKKSEQGKLSGPVPLMPIQKWFFSNDFMKPEHWNHSFLIKTPEINFEKLKESINNLVEQHDSFRLRYKKYENEWTQYYDINAPLIDIKFLDIKTIQEKEGSKEFISKLDEIYTSWQNNFCLEKGPLYSFAYVKGFHDKSARIFVALHHLLVDSVSWRIITEDLQSLYENKSLGKKGTSYRQWFQNIEGYATSHLSEKNYWDEVLSKFKDISLTLKKDIIKCLSPEGSKNKKEINLNQEFTQKLLIDCHKTYKTQINDILLSSFISALKKLTGNSTHHILLEGHGREELDCSYDVTKTVGWFTAMYPAYFEANEDLGKQIKDIKENLRKIPNKGIGFGALYNYEPNELPYISFNYLGQFNNSHLQLKNQSNWQIVNESSGLSMHSFDLKNNLITANSGIIDGCLNFLIETRFSKEITENLAYFFQESLQENIAHCIDFYLLNNANQKLLEQKIVEKEGYQAIVQLNNSFHKPDLFMVHPARAGCEVYTELAKAMHNDFHCYGVDYFNIHHEYKIEDIYVLAEYYLSKIEEIMEKSKQKTYHLFGWSLGGYISLEIASILEKRGEKNIFVYLLDSFCYDEYIIENKLSLDVFMKYAEHEFIKKDFDKVIENYEIENKFLDQKISSTLKFSKILLFKAMKNKGNSGNKKLELYLEYLLNLKENNIPSILLNKNQFKIVHANTATHLTIIQEEKFIIDEMNNFII